MQRFALITGLICFIVWIIPLGAFIDISKERMICHGKRAICLCVTLLAKRAGKKPVDKTVITAGGVSIEGSLGANNSPEFLSPDKDHLKADFSVFTFRRSAIARRTVYARPVEHVPKA